MYLCIYIYSYILSGSSDNLVNLWRIGSISSVPSSQPAQTSANKREDDEDEDENDDIKVKSNDMHEESIYALSWSVAEPWMYCSLSYDGRIILHQVPSSEKYKILL